MVKHYLKKSKIWIEYTEVKIKNKEGTSVVNKCHKHPTSKDIHGNEHIHKRRNNQFSLPKSSLDGNSDLFCRFLSSVYCGQKPEK